MNEIDTDIRDDVREHYSKVAKGETGCCSGETSCCSVSEQIGYSKEDLQSLPKEAEMGLGCGNPISFAGLKLGEVVLDLGSGGGVDCFLASKIVGPTGKNFPSFKLENLCPKYRKSADTTIDSALQNVTRQYLVGDLQKPQTLKHVPSSLIEIGITRYENETKLEAPHKHKQAFEFQYLTTGITAYLELGTGAEHVFGKGDFYVIEPGVTYAQKSAPGTEILFIKVPPGNDKVPVDTSREVEAWYREPTKEDKR